jgi:glycosyltransferase involved in cell wall biosynthesis
MTPEIAPRNVLFLTPSVRLLGARQSLLALVSHLPSHYFPHIIASGTGPFTQTLSEQGVPFTVIPHFPWRKLTGRAQAHLFQLPALRRAGRAFSPTIIHCNEFHSAPQGIWLGRALRSPTHPNGLPVTVHLRNAITTRQIQNYLLPRAAGLVAVSQSIRTCFEPLGLAGELRVIYNGIELSSIPGKSTATSSSLRTEIGWSPEDFVVALLGLVSPRKAQLVLAEAVARANARGGRIKLLLAGDAFESSLEYGAALRERLAQPDLAPHAHSLPFQKNVEPLYRAMDLNALISTEEGFGRTIIEAGAYAIPSVGSRIGGIPEIIVEGETGWLINEGDVATLTEVLLAASADRAELHRRGAAARERVQREFTLQGTVDRLVEYWEELLAGTNNSTKPT